MLPSTALLQRRGFYRLTLENAAPWWSYWTAGTAAQQFFENLASLTPVFPAGAPSSPVNEVWIQDMSVSDAVGNLTVGDLVTNIENRFYVKVRDVTALAPSQVGTGSDVQQQRDQQTQVAAQQKGKEDNRPAWLQNLLDVLKEARGIVALVLALGVLWYVGPWILAAARILARRIKR